MAHQQGGHMKERAVFLLLKMIWNKLDRLEHHMEVKMSAILDAVNGVVASITDLDAATQEVLAAVQEGKDVGQAVAVLADATSKIKADAQALHAAVAPPPAPEPTPEPTG